MVCAGDYWVALTDIGLEKCIMLSGKCKRLNEISMSILFMYIKNVHTQNKTFGKNT